MAMTGMKRMIARFKEINTLQKRAKFQTAVLKKAVEGSKKDVADIQRDVKRFTFKNQAQIDRINETLAKHKK
ncbi:hypothetical protein H7198_06150 [Fructobacillus sp. CRL 2054]|uniref:hypothetical protein n=1 Tax=Fructobacillus sp. CRL 2054 TaxID=2763007 RepID=UPI0023797D1A|nr:hypothetical protein [Fructobacillus sp. CRL 2054]MDD9139183.1 hypothetical protein [Fructobacillus sp. CRL 2054]